MKWVVDTRVARMDIEWTAFLGSPILSHLYCLYFRFNDLTHLIDILSIIRITYFIIVFRAKIEYGTSVENNVFGINILC